MLVGNNEFVKLEIGAVMFGFVMRKFEERL